MVSSFHFPPVFLHKFIIPRHITAKLSPASNPTPHYSRPKSKYADWEEPAQEGEPFDYDSAPNRFFIELESVGNMEPDQIVHEGIKELQSKFANLILGLEEDKTGGMGGGAGDGGGRSPGGMDADGGDPWSSGGQGFSTEYGNGGQSSWGGGVGGGTTPYNTTTPYGNAGKSGW